MRIALIGDIHANLPALDAVLRDAAAHGAVEIWNAGDTVGEGPFPDEVVRRLAAEEARSILGNVDLKVLNLPRKLEKWRLTKDPERLAALSWTWQRLSAGSRQYLRELPRRRRLRVARRHALLVHGSPLAAEEPVSAATSPERLAELARAARAELVVCAHAHAPFCRTAAGTLFVNTGSVGLPAGDDARACYALLSWDERRFAVEHRRVEYDIERTLAALRRRTVPPAMRLAFPGAARAGGEGDGIETPAAAPAPDPRLAAVRALAERCGYDRAHTEQVTRLALRLFDALRPLHGLGAKERFWLECGSLLHDIGWCEGQQQHHKTALRIILDSPLLPFDSRQRLLIGSIARYHRKAAPSERHEHFAALAAADRQTVRVAAALLRVADALDYTHRAAVVDVACAVTPERLELRCTVRGPFQEEPPRVIAKGALLAALLGRELAISWSGG